MRLDRAVSIGAPSEIITDASLAATYGIKVGVFTVARTPPSRNLTFCSPW
jgi:hypothetical protein